MAIEIENHQEIGNGLLPETLSLLIRFTGFLNASVYEQTQELEQVFGELDCERTIDDADGVTLGQLGVLVGAVRWDDATDAVYRKLIRATILVNRSKGRPQDVYAVVIAFFGSTDPENLRIREEFPAAFRVEMTGIPFGPDGIFLARLLRKAKAAGVGFQLVGYSGDETTAFRFSSTAATADTDAGTGFDWTEGYGTGGELAWSIDGTI